MAFLVVLLTLLLSGLGFVLHVALKRRRLLAQTWESVLARAEHVDLDGLRKVAACYLQPDRNQLRIETNEMWELLGGLEGMNRLYQNAGAMLDLAIYAERWDDAEGPVIAEMIRRDAARVQRAVTRVQLTFFLGMGFLKTPFYVQEAAATYYLMRCRLLGMYENCHVALLPRLEAAL